MNNLEFCNLLKEAKKLSGKSNVDIIVATRKSQGTLSDMMNGRADYTLAKYLPYINAIDFRLELSKSRKSIIISEPEDASKWLADELQNDQQSYTKLGEQIGVSHQTAMRIAKGGTLRLSVFLKLAELFGYVVTLDAK